MLVIPRPILDLVVASAQAEVPYECCGLLAGTDGRVTGIHLLRNVAEVFTEYEADPRDLLAAAKAARLARVDILAIYHSHPYSAPFPSRKDLARNHWGETVVHVIVGLAGPEPEVRAWWLGEVDYRPAEWGTEA